jgi:Rnl2 family RNA ligase
MFKKYSSIENVQRTKTLKEYEDCGVTGGEWVVQEKVHGSNFSFIVTEKSIQCGKRSGLVNQGENFFNIDKLMLQYKPNLEALFIMCSEIFQITTESLEVIVYGEIFGGSYLHPNVERVPNATRVQKGVEYFPDNEFYAFDLMVNGTFVNLRMFIEILPQVGFLCANPLMYGTLQECLEYPNEFQTTIPELFDLPPIENNICEGVVLKPVVAKFLPNGSRVILKNKNERFSEISKAPKKIKTILQKRSMTEGEKEVFEKIVPYVTENRLRNVLSHIGSVGDKMFGKVVGLFTKDVLDDFTKDNEECISGLNEKDKDSWKLIKNDIKSVTMGMVKENFVNIIDGEF